MQVRASDQSAPSRRRWLLGGAGLLLVLGAAAVWPLGLVSLERQVGHFGPAFGDGGSTVFYIERRSRGIVWGLGWEHFTPPAKARACSDALRLQRLDLSTGVVVTLESWDRSPIVGRTLEQYRGRLFSPLQVGLRPGANGAVDYRMPLALPR